MGIGLGNDKDFPIRAKMFRALLEADFYAKVDE